MNKQTIGYILLVGGLLGWMGMMIYIVIANLNNGEPPTLMTAIITLAAWGVFFVGKTLTRAQEHYPNPDA